MQSLFEKVDRFVAGAESDLVELRRGLHREPELSHEEFETTRRMARRLVDAGFDVRIRPEGTGFFADHASPGFDPERHRTVAIRCDLDALAIEEQTGLEFASQKRGVMHACGHDVHMSCAFGAATALAHAIDQVEGRIRVIYQHAEEVVGGADEMIEFGAMEGVDAIIALHVDPELPVGSIGVRAGAFTASFDEFNFEITGKSGHGARPHHCVDPVYVLTQLANALYNAVGRYVDARDPMVLSIGMISGGVQPNVIPGVAKMSGTVRTLTPHNRAKIQPLLVRIADGICAAHDATYDLDLVRGAPAIVNDPAITETIAEVGREILGVEQVTHIALPSMGSEDYSYYLQEAPGAMFRLGIAREDQPKYFLHSAHLAPAEEAITIGARILARAALRLLAEADDVTVG